MDRASLVADHKAALGSTAAQFKAASDADFVRHIDRAALDLGRKRKRTLLGSVTLVADEDAYDPPADLVCPVQPLWGLDERRRLKPWDPRYPKWLPRLTFVETTTGPKLLINPAPTAAEIGALGETYRFYYQARHVVDAVEANTTVPEADRGLLLLRAAAEAMRELALSGVTEPVQFHRGVGATPKNSTPQALHSALMEAFEREAKPW